MKLSQYIKELQDLQENFGDVDVFKYTHPYPDDWDDNDEITDVYGSSAVEVKKDRWNDLCVVERNSVRFGKNKNAHTVVMIG